MNVALHDVTKQGAGFLVSCSVGSLNMSLVVAADNDVAIAAAVKSTISNSVASFIKKIFNKALLDLTQQSENLYTKAQLDEFITDIYTKISDIPFNITTELNNYLIQTLGVDLNSYEDFMSDVTVERL